jgi:hypothetical protein
VTVRVAALVAFATLTAGAYAIVARDADGDEIIGGLTLDPSGGPGVSLNSGPGPVVALLAAAMVVSVSWLSRR